MCRSGLYWLDKYFVIHTLVPILCTRHAALSTANPQGLWITRLAGCSFGTTVAEYPRR
ncbi:hypothetical protein IWX62_000413 [Arthrobacter sp. CAN_A1]